MEDKRGVDAILKSWGDGADDQLHEDVLNESAPFDDSTLRSIAGVAVYALLGNPKAAAITLSKLPGYTKGEIAKALGVEADSIGLMSSSKPAEEVILKALKAAIKKIK